LVNFPGKYENLLKPVKDRYYQTCICASAPAIKEIADIMRLIADGKLEVK
jgi:hypothetical protein